MCLSGDAIEPGGFLHGATVEHRMIAVREHDAILVTRVLRIKNSSAIFCIAAGAHHIAIEGAGHAQKRFAHRAIALRPGSLHALHRRAESDECRDSGVSHRFDRPRIALAGQRHHRARAEAVTSDGDARQVYFFRPRGRVRPALQPRQLINHKAHVVNPPEQLFRSCAACQALLWRAIADALPQRFIAARMLHVNDQIAVCRPVLSPRFSAFARTAEAVRKNHQRQARIRVGNTNFERQ